MTGALRLDQLATVIRSKNAGPCLVTFDLIFRDADSYRYVADRLDALRDEVVRRYRRASEEVRVMAYEPALAVKITIPRDLVSGDIGDRDVYGAQQHGPLLEISL